MVDVSAKADTMHAMRTEPQSLLSEIDAFLAETGMGASYFGKAATGNSELVARLRSGGRVWPETIERARSFMAERRAAETEQGAA